jgi:hypothetical protein
MRISRQNECMFSELAFHAVVKNTDEPTVSLLSSLVRSTLACFASAINSKQRNNNREFSTMKLKASFCQGFWPYFLLDRLVKPETKTNFKHKSTDCKHLLITHQVLNTENSNTEI